MKFWQFVSVCEELNIQLSSIKLENKWDQFITWYNDFDAIVDKQDRLKLDYLVPSELCLLVFSTSKTIFYISDGYLRRRALGDSDTRVVASEVLKKYGGDKLEDMLEFGLIEI